MPDPDTIFALATPAAPSPIALVRISGPLVGAICRELLGAPLQRAFFEGSIGLSVGLVPAAAWVLPAPHTLTAQHPPDAGRCGHQTAPARECS